MRRILRVGFTLTLAVPLGLAGWISAYSRAEQASATTAQTEGLAAWQQVYSVLTHPRCINCHTATNYPQQGDDRHPHLFNVVRGQTGLGVPAFTRATCHQRANAGLTQTPPASRERRVGTWRRCRCNGKTRT